MKTSLKRFLQKLEKNTDTSSAGFSVLKNIKGGTLIAPGQLPENHNCENNYCSGHTTNSGVCINYIARILKLVLLWMLF